MKKLLSTALVLAIVFSLCACGSSSSENDSLIEKEIIGQWSYDTGSEIVEYTFDDIGICDYLIDSERKGGTSYQIKNGKLSFNGNDEIWKDFSVKVTDDNLELLRTLPDGEVWKFTKEEANGSATSATTLELTDDMIDEIEDEINDDRFELFFLARQALLVGQSSDKDLKFTDVEIASQKKTSSTTYTAYGTVYAEDNYGKVYKQNVDIVFTATKDDTESKGYSIYYDTEYK